MGASTPKTGFELQLKPAANGLSPDPSRLKMKGWTYSPRLCLHCDMGIESGLGFHKRLRRSAVFLNRSSKLPSVIFMHRGGPQGHDPFIMTSPKSIIRRLLPLTQHLYLKVL
jgi:hypothetical protein